jgi:peptide chain release factor 3
VFRSYLGSDWIVGVVGALQLDVLANRLRVEYDLEIEFEQTNFFTARWIGSDNRKTIEKFIGDNKHFIALDKNEDPVFLPRSEWVLKNSHTDWPEITFSSVKERGI